MEEDELAQIRKARFEQLKAEQGSRRGNSSGGSGGASTGQDGKQEQEAEARKSILSQILEPEAADRLGRIRLVKESRAVDVENRLIMRARSGQLRSKITEDELKELLNSVADKEEKEKIVVSRHKARWDDEDDDLLDL